MSGIRARLGNVILAFGLSSTLLGAAGTVNTTGPEGATAAEALERAAEQCGGGAICLWRDRNYQGTPWRWTPAKGYRSLPSYLRDHSYSFYADADGCFIDRYPEEKRRVGPGDYAGAYDTNFGKRLGAVGVVGNCP